MALLYSSGAFKAGSQRVTKTFAVVPNALLASPPLPGTHLSLCRSCALSWSKLLLFGNLLCLCGLGSYWLAGSPLEAKGRGVPPGTTVIRGLAERGPERRYSGGNGAGSGDVSTTNFVNKVSPSHRGSPGKGEGVECGDGGGSCKEGSKTATEDKLKEKCEPRDPLYNGKASNLSVT